MPSTAAIELDSSAWGYRTRCSWHDADRRSLIVRDLVGVPVANDLVVPATDDEVLVLVVRGPKRIESRSGGRIRTAEHGSGTVALTAPGHEGRFSWWCRDDEPQHAIWVHLLRPSKPPAAAPTTWTRNPLPCTC